MNTRDTTGPISTALRDYFDLIRRYPRFLAFGMLHTFYSGPGEPWSMAMFVPFVCASFGLTAGGFGLLFSVATIISAACLPLFGPLLDRYNLRAISVVAGLLMMVSGLIAASANWLPLFFIGILGLRFSGQGLMNQIAGVSTTRFYGAQRGKALAIVGLGFAVATAVFPISLALLISHFGWRNAFLLISLSCLVLLLPAGLALLKKTDRFQYPPGKDPNPPGKDPNQAGPEPTSWTRKEVLRSPFFYLALPILLVIPFVSTGLIIHLGRIASYKGWTMEWVAACFIVSAICGRLGSFLIGPVIDRFSAKRLFPYMLIPYVFALLVLMLSTHPTAAPIWLGMGGLGWGVISLTMSVLWAEVYGVKSLGAITSMITSLAVLATALSPALFGWLLDHGFLIDDILLGAVILTILVSILGLLAPTPGKRVMPAAESLCKTGCHHGGSA